MKRAACAGRLTGKRLMLRWVVSRIEQRDETAGQGGERPRCRTADRVRQLGGAVAGGLLGSLLAGDASSDGLRSTLNPSREI
jgi:hypothetical protein